MSTTPTGIIATYHDIEVPNGPHLGPQMIRNMKDGRYERREIRNALNEINAKDRVVEMGAGAGLVGAIIARHCTPEKILSFEANHQLLPHINNLYRHNNLDGQIEVRNQIVLSQPDPPKHVDFFIRGNFLGSGMKITKGHENAKQVRVPVATWDAVKKEINPTVLVMDIEGAELEFFQDADLSGLRTVIVELHRHIYHRRGMQLIRKKLLSAQGFVEDLECSGGGVFVYRFEESALD